MNSAKTFLAILLVAAAVLVFTCSRESPLASGSSSETVIGQITNSDGTPARLTVVTILPADYNPVTFSPRGETVSDTTDSSGAYCMRVADSGRYNIQAVQLSRRTRLLITGIGVSGDSTRVATGTLLSPGAIRTVLPAATDTINGYLYIPGTFNMVLLKGTGGAAVLDSVPCGVVPEILYGVIGTNRVPVLLADTVSVLSGDTAVTVNSGWQYSQRIFFNTTGSGAGVSGTVVNFPVLVRLTSPTFNFGEAKANGDDLRFARPNGSFCSSQVERWDSAAGVAEVWVSVDTIYGNDASHYIKMLWGNPSAGAVSSGPMVFDTASGFEAVWHLCETTGALAMDATYNHFDGTPSDTAPVLADGAVGAAKRFNGTSSFFDIRNTSAGKLSFQENGVYTVSAWAYADTLDNGFHVIVGKSDNQYFLKLKQYYPPNPMRWEFVEYHDKAGWQITDSLAAARTWCYLTGVRNGASQSFYLNGALVDTSIELLADTASRYAGDDVTIGKFLTYSSIDASFCPFRGMIDEVRISSTARNADWIKLCFMNQKTPDALVQFK